MSVCMHDMFVWFGINGLGMITHMKHDEMVGYILAWNWYA